MLNGTRARTDDFALFANRGGASRSKPPRMRTCSCSRRADREPVVQYGRS